MIKIESKPMLERTRRAYEIYHAKLKAERDSLYASTEFDEDKFIDLKVEIEAAESMISAIESDG